MASPIHVGTQSSVTGGSSLSTSSASATAGNYLLLVVTWALSSGGVQSAPAVSGWTKLIGGASSFNGTSGAAGVAYYEKASAASGVNASSFPSPDASSNLYAHGIIYEYAAGTTFDSTASASAIITDSVGGSSLGSTIPNTGTLANANSAVHAGLALLAATGVPNAHFAFGGGGWTADATDSDTSSSVGALLGHKAVTANTALGAVITWDGDSSILCFQGAIAVLSDPGGGGSTFPPVPEPPFLHANMNPILAR